MTADPAPSPLAQADPASLDLLFSADPLTLTSDDHVRLIIELRRRRKEFIASEAAAANKAPRTRTKPATVSAPTAAAMDKPVADISLDDL